MILWGLVFEEPSHPRCYIFIGFDVFSVQCNICFIHLIIFQIWDYLVVCSMGQSLRPLLMPHFNSSLLTLYSFTKHLMSSHYVASELVLRIQKWIKFRCRSQGILQFSRERQIYEWLICSVIIGLIQVYRECHRNTDEQMTKFNLSLGV